MIKSFIIGLLGWVPFLTFGQQKNEPFVNDTIRESKTVKHIARVKPLCFLNGAYFLLDTVKNEQKMIENSGMAFYEWKEGPGIAKNNLPIVQRYLGPSFSQAVFYFTKDCLQDINYDLFKNILKNNKEKVLFKVEDQHISDDINSFRKWKHKKHTRYRMMVHFPLKRWDTQETDFFTLIIITNGW